MTVWMSLYSHYKGHQVSIHLKNKRNEFEERLYEELCCCLQLYNLAFLLFCIILSTTDKAAPLLPNMFMV